MDDTSITGLETRNDQELISALNAGEVGAFEVLYRRLSGQGDRAARRRTTALAGPDRTPPSVRRGRRAGWRRRRRSVGVRLTGGRRGPSGPGTWRHALGTGPGARRVGLHHRDRRAAELTTARARTFAHYPPGTVLGYDLDGTARSSSATGSKPMPCWPRTPPGSSRSPVAARPRAYGDVLRDSSRRVHRSPGHPYRRDGPHRHRHRAGARTAPGRTHRLTVRPSVRSRSQVVGVTPRERRTPFSTFSVGVRGKLVDDVDVAGDHVAGHAVLAELDQLGGPVDGVPGRGTTATITSSSLSSLGTPYGGGVEHLRGGASRPPRPRRPRCSRPAGGSSRCAGRRSRSSRRRRAGARSPVWNQRLRRDCERRLRHAEVAVGDERRLAGAHDELADRARRRPRCRRRRPG